MYVDKARNATVNIGDRDLKTDVSRSYQSTQFYPHHILNTEDIKNIAKLRSCPDITIYNSVFIVVVVIVVVFIVVVFVVVVFLVSNPRSHSLYQNSKVASTHSLSHSVTKVKYRAVRAARK